MIDLVVDNTSPDNVVKLDTINLTDIAGPLRGVIDEIESGEIGDITHALLIMVNGIGEPLVVGAGSDMDRVRTLGMLEYAKHRFVQSLDDYDDE